MSLTQLCRRGGDSEAVAVTVIEEVSSDAWCVQTCLPWFPLVLSFAYAVRRVWLDVEMR